MERGNKGRSILRNVDCGPQGSTQGANIFRNQVCRSGRRSCRNPKQQISNKSSVRLVEGHLEAAELNVIACEVINFLAILQIFMELHSFGILCKQNVQRLTFIFATSVPTLVAQKVMMNLPGLKVATTLSTSSMQLWVAMLVSKLTQLNSFSGVTWMVAQSPTPPAAPPSH